MCLIALLKINTLHAKAGCDCLSGRGLCPDSAYFWNSYDDSGNFVILVLNRIVAIGNLEFHYLTIKFICAKVTVDEQCSSICTCYTVRLSFVYLTRLGCSGHAHPYRTIVTSASVTLVLVQQPIGSCGLWVHKETHLVELNLVQMPFIGIHWAGINWVLWETVPLV